MCPHGKYPCGCLLLSEFECVCLPSVKPMAFSAGVWIRAGLLPFKAIRPGGSWSGMFAGNGSPVGCVFALGLLDVYLCHACAGAGFGSCSNRAPMLVAAGEACVCVCRFVVVLVLLLCVLGTSMCHWILLWYYLDLLPIVPGLQQPLHVCRASLLALGAHSGIRLVVLILLGFYPGVVETALQVAC